MIGIRNYHVFKKDVFMTAFFECFYLKMEFTSSDIIIFGANTNLL
jgi:hypothetical protein